MTETPTRAPVAKSELRRAQADTWVYFDGELCQVRRRASRPAHPRAPLRHRMFRGHSRVLERAPAAHERLPDGRALRAHDRQRADAAHEAAAQRRRAVRHHRRADAPQRFPHRRLHPPAGVQGERGDRHSLSQPARRIHDRAGAVRRLRRHHRGAFAARCRAGGAWTTTSRRRARRRPASTSTARSPRPRHSSTASTRRSC